MITVVDPTPESFSALKRDVPPNTPIVMLNLLRFAEQAVYPAGSEHAACSGREAYGRYSAHAHAAVGKAGGSLVFAGSALSHPIAPAGEQWDEILLVAYPNIDAFLGMVMAPDYQQESVHRSAALADARLVCMQQSGT